MTPSCASSIADDLVETRADGVRLRLKVTPKASRNRCQRLERDADGVLRLRVAVTAAPEKGKANRAVIALLAKALGLARGALAVSAGETGRLKTLDIHGDAADLRRRIRAAVDGCGLACDP